MTRKIIFTTLIVAIEIALIYFGIMFTLADNFIGILMLIVAGALLLYLVIGYNNLIRYRNKITESLALVDIQLKLRFDLIPNLVNTIKGYAKHEKELFSQVTKLRNLATTAKDEKEKLEYANQLVPHMKHLIAVAEGYPDIKSSKLYQSLMEQLVDIEDRLVSARRIYDSNVNIYNTAIEVFPRNILAKVFAFKKEELFKIDAGESINVSVK